MGLFDKFKKSESEDLLFKNYTGNHEKFETQKKLEEINIDHEIAEDWYNQGVNMGSVEKHAEEIRCYQRALEINPDHAKAWNNLAVALGKFGKHDEEIVCYAEALKINPEDAETWYNLGVTLMESDKLYESIECFRKALKIDKNFEHAAVAMEIALNQIGE